MITVHLPQDLADAFRAQIVVDLEARDCQELLHRLNMRYPGIAQWLATEDGRFRQHLSLFIAGQRQVSGEVSSTAIPEKSGVWILRAISGG